MTAQRVHDFLLITAVTSLLAINAQAAEVPPAAAAAAPSELSDKRIVLLYDGAKYCGRVDVAPTDGSIAVTLAGGKVQRFAAQDVMRVVPAVGAHSPARIVVLTDGTMLRGELVEHVPRDHLTLLLGGGAVQRFPSAQIYQVNHIATAAPRAQLSYHDVPYGGEVMEYRPNQSIALRLDSGELRHFPLNEAQQLTGFAPIIPPPPPPPPPNLLQPVAYANAAYPYLAMHHSTPAERKEGGKTLLIVGGIVTAVGIGMVTTSAVVFRNVRSGDQDPIGGIFGMFGMIAFSPNLLAGPIMLGVGGYRYTTPDE